MFRLFPAMPSSDVHHCIRGLKPATLCRTICGSEIEVHVDCSQAQALLRTGAIPGAGAGRVPQLGFHLAGCPTCRAFRRIEEFERTQAALTPLPPRRLRQTFPIRPLSLAAASMALLLLIGGWYLGLPLLRAWHDVSAMTSLGTPPVIHGDQASMLTSASDQDTLRPKSVVLPDSAETLPPTSEVTELAPADVAVLDDRPNLPANDEAPAESTTALDNDAVVYPTQEPGGVGMAGGPLDSATPLDLPGVAADIPVITTERFPSPGGDSASSIPIEGVSAPRPPAQAIVEPTPPPLTAASTSGRELMSEPAAHTTDSDVLTVLVLGIDARPGEGPLARSDAIMVVRLNVATQRVAMLSLPRDLWVSIPGYREGKIDSAYFLGELSGQGAAVATETVSQVLGINIDRTVVMNFDGFRNLIDTIGGVTIDVPRELYDPQFPTDDYGYTVAHFLPGPQIMDGERALMYSRIRHPDSDFERMRRQQSVVIAIADKLRDRGALKNLHEADRLTGAVKPFMRTDLPRSMALNLLWSMRSVDMDTVKRITVDTSRLREANIGGAYALLADPADLEALGAQLVADD
jgi:polyisoprenyl-teichoic acid--peptidoglycan teichoic acid transferase